MNVIRVDDGAIAELPLSLYYLLGGQWPMSNCYDTSLPQALADSGDDTSGRPPRGPTEPAISPNCRAWVSFVNKGEPVANDVGLSIHEMIDLGHEAVDALREEVRRHTTDHDLLRVNFKNDGEDGGWHVRLGPSPREAYEATGFCNPMFKGGGVLAFIDQLFWLAETTKKATP